MKEITKNQLRKKKIEEIEDIAKVHRENQEWEAEEQCYKELIQRGQNYIEYYLKLIKTLKQQKKSSEFIKVSQQVIKLTKKKLFDLYKNLGNELREKGQIKEAIEAYEDAIKINPKATEIYRLLGKTQLFDQKDQLKAIVSYQKAIEINPKQPIWVYMNLGSALAGQNRLTEAQDCYEKANYQLILKKKSELISNYWERKTPEPVMLIGAGKAGTTSLHDYICQHPQIWSGLKKEINFFVDHSFKEGKEGLDWYLSHFPKLPSNCYTLDASIVYFNAPKVVAQRIQESFPHTKLIVILRNPIDRLVSHYNHHKRHKKAYHSLEEIINSQIKLFEGVTEDSEIIDQYSGWFRSYLQYGLYVFHFKKWMSFFPREQFLILTNEQLSQEPEGVMKEVFNFIGVSPWDKLNFKQLNIAVGGYSSHLNDDLYSRLRDFYSPYNQQLEEYLGMKFDWT